MTRRPSLDKILVAEDSLTIAGSKFETSPTISELKALLGRPYRYSHGPDDVYTWHALGVYAYVSRDQMEYRVSDVNVDFAAQSYEAARFYEFCPKRSFAGKVVVGDLAFSKSKATTMDDLEALGFRRLHETYFSPYLDVGKLQLVARVQPPLVVGLLISTEGLPKKATRKLVKKLTSRRDWSALKEYLRGVVEFADRDAAVEIAKCLTVYVRERERYAEQVRARADKAMDAIKRQALGMGGEVWMGPTEQEDEMLRFEETFAQLLMMLCSRPLPDVSKILLPWLDRVSRKSTLRAPLGLEAFEKVKEAHAALRALVADIDPGGSAFGQRQSDENAKGGGSQSRPDTR